MFRRIVPCVGVLALGFALVGCNGTEPGAAAPPGNAALDTGVRQTGNSPGPLGGGAAAVGSRPSGAISTTPTQ